MRLRSCAIWAGSAMLAAGGPAHADLVTIGASMDNTLYESATGSLSNGAGDHFFAGQTAVGNLRRGLIFFDIASAVPAGATINSVTLTLNMSRTVSGDSIVSLHRALAAWGEGDSHAAGEEGSGAAAAPGDATWLHTMFDTDFWTSEGGDFDAVASASQTVGGVSFYSWSSATLVSDVQGWLDSPSMNFGWFLIGDETSIASAKRFDSHENPTEANRPQLTIDFTPIPAPGAAVPFGLGALGLARRRRRRV